MSSQILTLEERRFIDDWAALLVPWAMPMVAGRVYGYLLLRDEPVSLDQMAADLELSKSNASVTTRLLEKHGLAIRHSVRGSKRALYSLPDNDAGLLMEKARLLGAMSQLLQSRAHTIGSEETARRFEKKVYFYTAMRDVIESSVQRLTSEMSETED